jgi:signal peptidase II
MKKALWFLFSGLIIVLDQLSKYAAGLLLIPYHPVPVVPFFNLMLAYNTGAAFGFLSSMGGDWHRYFFSGFSFLISLWLIAWLIKTKSSDILQSFSLSLILGGALGNLVDRVWYGYVVDFIDLYYKHYHFATFNIADSAICIGAAGLILHLLLHRK